MTATLTDQALVVHLFVTDDARDALRTAWDACSAALGMDRPVAALGLPEDLPGDLPRAGAVAARQTADRRRQAIVRRHRDVLVLSAALAGDDWADLESAWTSAIPSAGDRAFGETRIFAAAGRPTGEVGERVPGTPALGPPAIVDGHTTLWETAGGADDRRLRRIVALSHEGRSAESDAWLWSRGDDGLPPFARYLLHIAKIRYQLRVRDRYDQERHVASVGRDADAAVAEARRVLLTEPPAPAALLDVRARLAAQTVRSTGLVEVRTRLAEMTRTVEIAVSNAHAPAHRGLFGDDRALAEWFAQRLADDAHYLEAAAQRVHDVLAALSMAVEAALDERREEVRADEAAAALRRERLNLLQTAIIGAALMTLAAVQALQYRPPLPPSLRPPVIAALGAVTLLLATMALWTRSDHAVPVWTGRIACGLSCATLGWLGTSAVGHLTTARPSPPALTLVIGSLAFTVGLLTSLRLVRRHPRSNTPGDPR
ncbi:MAG TPA: CATRA conflict system CASPASE/TPR repeat-associated protein [Thermomonospora sp.]|nr:CATRA conflict system CASPASE/TPR repeat-associated protein [Thermomonospora sp.]